MNEQPGPQTFEEFESANAHMFAPPFASKFKALFLDDLDAPGPEFEFLIDGFMSAGDRSVIGGPSQSGKSFLAIHAGMCVAMGQPFFGADVQQGLVIYEAGEGARGVKKRLRAWRKHHDVQFSRDTPFVLIQSPIDLFSPDGDAKNFTEECLAIAALYNVPLRLVVIDTLATASAGAEENSSKDMGVVLKNVANISAATGAHVCLVHHMNAGGTKLRGSTSIYANLDQVMLVTRNEVTKVRTAVLDKQKDDEAGGRVQFELMSVPLGSDNQGKPITSCVCLPVGQKDSIRREEEVKGYRLEDGEIIFMKALFEADRTHGQPVPDSIQVDASVRSVVSYIQTKKVYAAISPDDGMAVAGATDEDREAASVKHRDLLKKRLKRQRESLTRLGIIGVDGDFIWWTGRPLRAFPHTLPKRDDAYEPPSGFPDDGLGNIPF